jgi:hypothetical protein
MNNFKPKKQMSRLMWLRKCHKTLLLRRKIG